MNKHKEPGARNVLITGASSGIGKATAQLLAVEGFRVFGTSRRKRPDQDGVEMLELDVRSEDSVEHCVGEALARAGQIDVLINNAGIEHVGVAEETTLEDAHAVFETNFFGVVRLTNAVLPGMRRRRHGRIINVGSLAAWVGEPGEAFYSASKHALAGYTEALRQEVWPLGIDVSLLELGAFKTNIIQNTSLVEGTITDYDAVRSAARRTLQDSLRQGGDPKKAAELILKIARARSPLMHYRAGSEALWIPYLKVLLPQRLFDYLIRRGFGLDR
ncbi:MAG: SDR family NAD(P)-dependent oxidoreductase [Anaerolineales bacterium]|jgi:NAD(P)-dependent dehydrogenase (short-subunit alcohol dehydrogenase family)